MIDMKYAGTRVVYICPESDSQKGIFEIRNMIPRGDDTQLIITNVETGLTSKALGSELKPYVENLVSRKEFEEAMQATIAGYSFHLGDECLAERLDNEKAEHMVNTAIDLLGDLHGRLFND